MAEPIYQVSGCWNSRVIDDSFLPFEAQQIKAILLCASAQSKFLYWSLEKNGIYSVKSGYAWICEEARNDEALSSVRSATLCVWARIWKLKALGRIKHFLWNACANSLPTKVNFMK